MPADQAEDANPKIACCSSGQAVSSIVDAKIRYNLTRALDETLSVSSAGDYQLYLHGVTIIGTAGPAMDLESSRKVFIVTASGTTNVLMDSATRSMTMKAALYCEGPMVFSGEGVLMVTGSYKHGIYSDDYIRVRAGELDVAVSARDAVRSVNGSLTITGGVIVVAIDASVPESAFDCDQNTFAITGGSPPPLVGIGGALSMPTAAACAQNVVILGSGTKGFVLGIKAADGTVAFAFTIPQSYATMVLSSPDIETGTLYTTYSGGTASGDETFHGLYLGNLSYFRGTAGSSFTVSSRVTNIGWR